MDNQHTKITGYRSLTQAEIDLMNKIKEHGLAIELLLQDVQAHCGAQYHATEASYAAPKDEAEEVIGTEMLDTPEQTEAKRIERERINRAQPFRWHAIATTHLQEGLMALTRAVAQPTTF